MSNMPEGYVHIPRDNTKHKYAIKHAGQEHTTAFLHGQHEYYSSCHT